jgi:hypothetical protein
MIETKAEALDARRGKVVELLDLGKEMSTWDGRSDGASLRSPGRRMEGLRARRRRPRMGRGGRSPRPPGWPRSRHADEEPGLGALQGLHAPEVGEDLFLGLLAHRARVEKDEVGLGRVGRLLVAFGCREHVGHLVRVVLVHLASERADVDLLLATSSWGRLVNPGRAGGVGIFPHPAHPAPTQRASRFRLKHGPGGCGAPVHALVGQAGSRLFAQHRRRGLSQKSMSSVFRFLGGITA